MEHFFEWYHKFREYQQCTNFPVLIEIKRDYAKSTIFLRM